MGESQGPAGETVGTERDRTPEQVREEIERTRIEMGETVAQLAAKADIKGQAHQAVDNAKATVSEKAHDVTTSAAAKKAEISAAARGAMPPSADAARRQMVTRVQEHRVAVIAVVAFGAGMLIGKRRG
ncbi:MAG TPA: DUF3618 domain-containing protein [Solirubrobacteraceae bacterium]|jgi:transposase-like protein|nr:DUF3618 domain-containing protein [Solirubrobacteraceae bacterium]